jgi:hypothetical protein
MELIMELQKVSTREFKNNISHYLSGKDPIALLQDGQTIGYYLPFGSNIDNILDEEIETLKLAAQRLDTLLQSKGITEDELVEEFQRKREKDSIKRRDSNR